MTTPQRNDAVFIKILYVNFRSSQNDLQWHSRSLEI